jgi:hypothetical protein
VKTTLPLLALVLALFGCDAEVRLLVVNGCEPESCTEVSVTAEMWNAMDLDSEPGIWQEAADLGGHLIYNKMEDAIYLSEIIYAENPDELEDDGDWITLEPGVTRVEHWPDYIMETSPDEIAMLALQDQATRWELICLNFEDLFEGMTEEELEGIFDALLDE